MKRKSIEMIKYDKKYRLTDQLLNESNDLQNKGSFLGLKEELAYIQKLKNSKRSMDSKIFNKLFIPPL